MIRKVKAKPPKQKNQSPKKSPSPLNPGAQKSKHEKSLSLSEPSQTPALIDRRKDEALQLYIRQMKAYPLLSPEKEFEIAARYRQTQNKEDAQLLVLANLRLVVKIAHDYIRTGLHVLDLIQEGNLGLLQAVREYDPHRGVKFSSYASYWVKAYIRSFILKNWSLVKMGTTRAQRMLFYRLQKERNLLEALGEVATPKFLAEKLNVRESDVNEMTQRLSGKDVSLSNPLSSDESGSETFLTALRDPQISVDQSIADREIQNEFHQRLDAFERTLSGKELVIMRERLRSEEPRTLQEIGETYGITRERVRQLEARVMEKLKAYLKEHAHFMNQRPVIDITEKDS